MPRTRRGGVWERRATHPPPTPYERFMPYHVGHSVLPNTKQALFPRVQRMDTEYTGDQHVPGRVYGRIGYVDHTQRYNSGGPHGFVLRN
jgi:hypothetical protein